MVSGSMRGTEVPIKKTTVTIGRSTEADVQVHDILISRIHCRLQWEDGQWFIEDCGSTNGTWMIGRKVDHKVPLPMKTSVRIGNTLFELIDVFSGDTQVFTRPFITYSIQPETLVAIKGSPSKTQDLKLKLLKEENQRLAAVYKFQNMIAAVLDEDELYHKILSALMNVLYATKAYLLIYDLESGKFTPIAGRDENGVLRSVTRGDIQSSVVDFVRENRESVLSIDENSVVGAKFEKLDVPNIITSTMCVPMLGKRQVNGMIYVSLTCVDEKYSEDDLRLLTVIGHTAGMAVENSRLVEFNLKNERLVATGATAAGLSHYIKNILAGLDGSLTLLKMGIREHDFDIADEALSILSKNHSRLGNLVLDLLNLASEQKPDFEIYDVNQIVNDVVELVKEQLKKENIGIDVQTQVQPLFAEIDSKGIHRVILNLILNAQEAILSKKNHDDKNGQKGQITIFTGFNKNADYVVVKVQDDGVGLSEEELGSMFELFVTSKGSVGTGLGLAVSKRIVNAHEGSISAKSEKGKGCTITFSLPVTHNEMTTVTRTIKRI
jgi:signal transduction histidine kinase